MSHVATSASTSAAPPVPPFSRFRFLTVASARLFLAAGASKALRRFATLDFVARLWGVLELRHARRVLV
jgi:hypothetical protein